MSQSVKPVLVLGAGINGAAIARELLLNGIPVYLVDNADIASGATAASTRLVHGGLRYLEYADFTLVREALVERERLLQLAPHFVRPLRFFIPVQRRISGVLPAAARFLRSRLAAKLPPKSRGMWLVRVGLHWYDTLAKQDRLPKHQVHSVGQPGTPAVNQDRYRWLCSYYDAQMAFPERFTIALLQDASQIAAEKGIELRVLTYHQASLDGHNISIVPVDEPNDPQRVESGSTPLQMLQPSAIVNATGAWVDHTLQQMDVPSQRLMGGTKGSHFLTSNRFLRNAIGQSAIYAEAADMRPVFLIPLGNFVLVGTTDIPIEGDPQDAVTVPDELRYLLDVVHGVFPDIQLESSDIAFHYCGVRPLPFSTSKNPAAVTRRHILEENPNCAVPLISLVGGKLTSCREAAEETAALVCRKLEREVIANSRHRLIPGAEDYPEDDKELHRQQQTLGQNLTLSEQQIQAVWSRCGTMTAKLLAPSQDASHHRDHGKNVPETEIPMRFARHVIREEFCTRLVDLVERRLLLLYDWTITASTLQALARLMVEERILAESAVRAEIADCKQHLKIHFGVEL